MLSIQASMTALPYTISVFLLAQVCTASDFLGAMIFWKPSTDGKTIDIDYRQAWRRSSQSPECNETTMAQGFNYSEGLLQERSYTSISSSYLGSSFSTPFAYNCTDYSVIEDWQSGRGHIRFAPYDSTRHIYHLEYAGCCWISTLPYAADPNWLLMITIDTTIRKDTGKINSSPMIDFPPIVRLQYGCNHTIHLPVSDDDGDVVKCRWARSTEASFIAYAFTDATLHKDTCTLTYMADKTLGWFPVAIQIEDYNYISSQPLSSIPLQFLVTIEGKSNNCTVYEHERPKFVGLTLPEKACLGVVNGTDFTTTISIQSGCGGSISEVNTTSLIGLVKSSLKHSNLTGNWHISVKWNPNKTDSVNNVFCFTAVDDAGLSSGQRCITLLAMVPPANIIPSSKLPSSQVVPANQRVWSLTFDQESKRPTKSAYIYLYYANGTLVETIDVFNSPSVKYLFQNNSATLQFTTTANLLPGHHYYFLFGQDPGHNTGVEVHCYRGIYEVLCQKSFLSCEENWSFQSPCSQAHIKAGHTKFPHPTADDKFLTCDLSGKTYIAHCPPGEVFHAECSQCAIQDHVATTTCGTQANGVENPCTAFNILQGNLNFPIAGSSSRYIHCDVWGHPWEQHCPQTFIWDQNREECIQESFFIG